jgi:hypothetical protein
VKNICYLDNAFCNKKERLYFLNILNNLVIVGNFNEKNGDFNVELYLKWILKLNIFLNSLYINRWSNEIQTTEIYFRNFKFKNFLKLN